MITRRSFLRGTIAATLAACGNEITDRLDGGVKTDPIVPDTDAGMAPPEMPDAAAAPATCAPDPFEGGMRLGTIDILDSGSPDYGRLYDQGLDARLYTDTRAIPDDRITPAGMYYVRTAQPDALPAADGWKLKLGGMVEAGLEIDAAELIAAASDRGTYVMECSGNSTHVAMALISAGSWRGVKVGQVLDRVKPAAGAARILFSGYDRHDGPSETSQAGASWVFSREQLERAGAFIATHLDGEPLSVDHGAPLRLYVPGWYGCCCIKWLNQIDFVADDIASTPQMIEFAHRTGQNGEPELARDYAPVVIEAAAMGVRAERWKVGDQTRIKVWGITWGGDRFVNNLQVRFLPDDTAHDVRVCPAPGNNRSWAVWSLAWDPPGPGTYTISCHFDDASVKQTRLDEGHYNRTLKIS